MCLLGLLGKTSLPYKAKGLQVCRGCDGESRETPQTLYKLKQSLKMWSGEINIWLEAASWEKGSKTFYVILEALWRKTQNAPEGVTLPP